MPADNRHEQRGTLRTLAVLRALNEQSASSVSDLSQSTAIPRPSLYRILDTLCGAGYVRRRIDDDRYQLTPLIHRLSDGFEDDDWIKSIGVPFLRELQREIVWPTDIAVFQGDAMYLRATTWRDSPLAIDRRPLGLRVPVLQAASGRAYLAYCPKAECEEVIGFLSNSSAAENALARDRKSLNRILAQTRTNGYGQRFKEFMMETGSIAVPICSTDRVVACLNITFIASALTPKQAASRYLGPINRTARQIEASIAKRAG
jgi:IclR family mhp operon transcriptional activator